MTDPGNTFAEQPTPEPVDPAYTGPYDAELYGTDANGDPVNAYGRTQAMNESDPPARG